MMDETARELIAQWKRQFPTAREGSPSTIDLAAGEIRAARDAEVESELWGQVGALELSLAQRRDVADAVELAQPVESSTFGTDAVATAALVNKAVDLHGAAVEAALSGDQAALSAALQAHANALRAVAGSTPSAAGSDPSQYHPPPVGVGDDSPAHRTVAPARRRQPPEPERRTDLSARRRLASHRVRPRLTQSSLAPAEIPMCRARPGAAAA
jgi:hypothetical protein